MTTAIFSAKAEQPALTLPGEAILWQGRPDTAPFITARHIATVVQGALALGLFLYLVTKLRMAVPAYWDVRAIVLFIFFKSAPFDIVASVLQRRAAVYFLTAKRAIIVSETPFGQKLRSYPIDASTPLDFQRGKRFSSLYFAKAKPGMLAWLWPNPAPGFERLRNGDKLFALVSALQQGKP